MKFLYGLVNKKQVLIPIPLLIPRSTNPMAFFCATSLQYLTQRPQWIQNDASFSYLSLSQIFQLLLRLIIVLVFPLYLSGCASFGPTKPNLPFAGNSYPAILSELAQTNPLFVQELGKLPELQGGVSEKEMFAINNILELYKSDPANFKNAFTEMYKVGLPEHRKYCSPLQAFFWLAEDKVLDSHTDLLSDYTLRKLLKEAWNTDPLSTRFLSDRQIREVIDGIENENIKKMYLDDLQNGNTYYQLQSSLVAEYNRSKRRSPHTLSEYSAKIIEENLLNRKSSPRWGNNEKIIERLNAPELLDFYIDNNIKYFHKIPSFHRHPNRIINEKYGDCDDLANFGRIILSKAGYDVFGRKMMRSNTVCHIGLGVKLEDGSYLLAVNFFSSNHMSGPYRTMLEFDYALGVKHGCFRGEPFYFNW